MTKEQAREAHWRQTTKEGVVVGAFLTEKHWMVYAQLSTESESITVQRRLDRAVSLESAQAEAIKCGACVAEVGGR